MGLLKAFGAAATSLGSSLQQAGSLKHKEELLEDQRTWEWKKMEWLADKESTAATSASRIKAYETILDQVGKEITSIDKTLGGTPNVIHSGYDKEYLNKRRKALATLSARASSLLMGKSGIPQDEISAFFEATKKLATTKPGDDTKLTEKEEQALADNTEEGEGFLASVWGYMPGEFLKGTPRKIHFLGEAIKDIAWENDILLNAIKKYGKEVGKVFIPNEDSDIRQAIASVLEGDESIANAKSEEDVKNIIKDKGVLSSIVRKIMGVLEADTPEEWEGTGPAPGEPDPDLNQRMLEDQSAGIIEGQKDRGLIARADTADPTGGMVDADMEEGYGRQFASTELPPGAMDDTALPPGEMTTTPRGETLETPPAPTEPYDANYVEGRDPGTTPITSMTVGEIAEQYGYSTRVGMMALTYNEIIDLVQKHFYKGMSKKEVREKVDKIPFGDKIQKDLLYLSLGAD